MPKILFVYGENKYEMILGEKDLDIKVFEE